VTRHVMPGGVERSFVERTGDQRRGVWRPGRGSEEPPGRGQSGHRGGATGRRFHSRHDPPPIAGSGHHEEPVGRRGAFIVRLHHVEWEGRHPRHAGQGSGHGVGIGHDTEAGPPVSGGPHPRRDHHLGADAGGIAARDEDRGLRAGVHGGGPAGPGVQGRGGARCVRRSVSL
jgi:hypothetical protein